MQVHLKNRSATNTLRKDGKNCPNLTMPEENAPSGIHEDMASKPGLPMVLGP